MQVSSPVNYVKVNHLYDLTTSNIPCAYSKEDALQEIECLELGSAEKSNQSTQIIQEINYENGDSYKGQVYNQMPHGYGKLTMRNGVEYKGVFNKGIPTFSIKQQPRL